MQSRIYPCNKIIKPLPIQRHLSPNSNRLQYPLYGEYGFQEPTGRKKYQPSTSPIHQLLFNHRLPTPPKPQQSRLSIMRRLSLDAYNNSEHSTSPINDSDFRQNYSQIYQPASSQTLSHQNSAKNQPNSSQINAPAKISANLRSFQMRQAQRSEMSASKAESGDFLGRKEYQRRREWNGEKVDDSLDRLLSPYNDYNLRISKEREKFLDEMVKLRSKNPTFLNSHLR